MKIEKNKKGTKIKMTTLQLPLKFQNKQDKETKLGTVPSQAAKKDNNQSRQNKINSYKSTNLEKIRSLNYALSPIRHIQHSSFIEESNEPKIKIKEQLEEFIEEFKKLAEEEERLNKIILENLDKIILENPKK